MHKFTLLLTLLMLFANASAQTPQREVRRFECEPNIGIATSGFLCFSTEFRYNFPRAWDVGINGAMDFNGSRFTLTGDYNLRRKKNASFFFGLGVGYAHTDILQIDQAIKEYGDACCVVRQGYFCLNPRIGVELFNHLRLSATILTYDFREAELLITLGVAIGGGRKKE